MKKLCLRRTIFNIIGCALVIGVVLINSAQAASQILNVLHSSRQPIPDVRVEVINRVMGSTTTFEIKTDCKGRVTIVGGNLGGSSCQFVSVKYSFSLPGYTFSPSEGTVPCGTHTEVLEVIAT